MNKLQKIFSENKKLTKKDISNKFAELRKNGYLVFNFSSHKKMLGSCKGFTDLVIMKAGFIWFIEIKLYKDTYSELQLETEKSIRLAVKRNSYIKYFLVDEKNVDEVINSIYYLKIY